MFLLVFQFRITISSNVGVLNLLIG